MFRSPFAGPRVAKLPVVDGVPCRPYRIGEHAATISAMLLRRLVVSAIVAAAANVVGPIVITAATIGTAATSADVPALARVAGSPIVFGFVLLAVDYLLVRGRLGRALSVLTWAGRRDAAALRELTGIRRPTDRLAARAWLADHPATEVPPDGLAAEPAALTALRVHLETLVGDLAAARGTALRLPRDTPEQAATAATLEASIDLAAGQGFDAAALKAQVERVADPERRAELAAETAALIAQARFTCLGDHLAAIDWALPFVGERDAGVLLRGYWIPIAVLVLATSAALSLLFPTV